MQRAVVLLALCLSCLAKDKRVVQIQVVSSDTSVNTVAVNHPASNDASTNCTTDGTLIATTTDNTTSGRVNASTNCTTTGSSTPAYTTHVEIEQDSIKAVVVPTGERVVLGCQPGKWSNFRAGAAAATTQGARIRQCPYLYSGTYSATVSGNSLKIGKYKYRIVGSWQ